MKKRAIINTLFAITLSASLCCSNAIAVFAEDVAGTLPTQESNLDVVQDGNTNNEVQEPDDPSSEPESPVATQETDQNLSDNSNTDSSNGPVTGASEQGDEDLAQQMWFAFECGDNAQIQVGQKIYINVGPDELIKSVKMVTDHPEVVQLTTGNIPYVVGLTPGSATLTASYYGKTMTLTIDVLAAPEDLPDTAVVSDTSVLAENNSFTSVLSGGKIWTWDIDNRAVPTVVCPDINVKSYITTLGADKYQNQDMEKKGEIDPRYFDDFLGCDNDDTLYLWAKKYGDDTEFQQYKIADNVKAYRQLFKDSYLYLTNDGSVFLVENNKGTFSSALLLEGVDSLINNEFVLLKDGSTLEIKMKLEEGKDTKVSFATVDSVPKIISDWGYRLDNKGVLTKRNDDGQDVTWDFVEDGVSDLNGTWYLKGSTAYSANEVGKQVSNISKVVDGGLIDFNGDFVSYEGTTLVKSVKSVRDYYVLDQSGRLYFISWSGQKMDYEATPIMGSVVFLGDRMAQRKDGSVWTLSQTNDSAPRREFEISAINGELNLTDEATGIKVNGVSSGVSLVVEQPTGEQEATTKENIFGQVSESTSGQTSEVKNSELFDIALKKDDGDLENLEKSVLVTMPVPEEMRDTSLAVFHQKKDGNIEQMDISVSEDGTAVSFEASSFSPYMLVSYAGEAPKIQQGSKPDEGKKDEKDPESSDGKTDPKDPESSDGKTDPKDPEQKPETGGDAKGSETGKNNPSVSGKETEKTTPENKPAASGDDKKAPTSTTKESGKQTGAAGKTENKVPALNAVKATQTNNTTTATPSTGNASTVSAPKTGDTTPIALYVVLFVLAMAGVSGMVLRRRGLRKLR